RAHATAPAGTPARPPSGSSDTPMAGRSKAGGCRRLAQGHLPLVQIAGLCRALQRVGRSGRLVRAEPRTAPAAGADRLDAALAHLVNAGVMLHGEVPHR